MVEESDVQVQTDKGKVKESNQDEEDNQDDTESAVDSETEDDEDDEDGDEPKLKYVRLTGHLGPVYRNGDATSAFLVAGGKMVSLGETKSKILAEQRYSLLEHIMATS
jgi:hypothetical protein